jgi:uncharacterized damage-inducible protein DinB
MIPPEFPPMTDDFAALFDFNRWANDRMFGACRQLSAEQYAAEPVPGWTPVRLTVVHMAVVTEAWLRSLAGDPDDKYLTEAEMPTLSDAERLIERAYRHFDTIRPNLTPEWLTTTRRIRGRTRMATLPPWVVLRQVINHTTYHRGQVASKLKRFGVVQPETDLVLWAFEHFPQGG